MIIAYCVICIVIWIVFFYLWTEEIARGYSEVGLKIFFGGLFWPLVVCAFVVALILAGIDDLFKLLASKLVKFKEGRKP